MQRLTIVLVHFLAVLVPFLQKPDIAYKGIESSMTWPTEIGGVPLTQVALSEEERGFSTGFPGKVGRFSAGDQEVVIRIIERPSRKLHPSADCLRGAGYQISPQPARRDQDGQLWGCVLANKKGQSLKVCEQITDPEGGSWYDVSSWYWAALLRRTSGPWREITVAERFEAG